MQPRCSHLAQPRSAALIAPLLLALAATTCLAAEPVWVSGITEVINDSVLSSPVIGIIGARPFQEGSRVKQGEIVVELDKRLEEIEVVRKRLIRDHARAEMDRAKALAEKSNISISREELEKKQAEFEVSAAEQDFAVEQLHRRQIVAPFDGVIAEYFLKVGEGCQAQQPLVRVVDTSRCYFVANVEARAGHYLKTGDPAKLEVESGLTTLPVTGSIYFVSPVADPASGLMKVKVVFENREGKVRPGVAGRLLLPENPDGK